MSPRVLARTAVYGLVVFASVTVGAALGFSEAILSWRLEARAARRQP
jgi:hypothetical protein